MKPEELEGEMAELYQQYWAWRNAPDNSDRYLEDLFHTLFNIVLRMGNVQKDITECRLQ